MARTPQTDIDTMTVRELSEFHSEITRVMAEKKISEKAELKAKLAALANESGFSLEDILGLRKGKGAGKSLGIAKYRNPENSEETWTGRGRKPNWLVDKLKKRGVTMDEFAI